MTHQQEYGSGTPDPQDASSSAQLSVGDPLRPAAAPRVLYLTDLSSSNKFGSMEEQILELARSLQRAGGLFLPVYANEPSQRVRTQYGAEGLEVEGLNLHVFDVPSAQRLVRLIREHAIDVVHWNFYSPINPYVWFLSLFAPRVRHFRTDHGSRTLPLPAPSRGPKRIAQKLVLSRYRKVFGISDFVVSALDHSGIWANVSRCNYFVNTQRFSPDADVRTSTRTALGAGENFIVLLVGQLIPEKGGDVAIRAVASLPPSVVLWVVGEGAERERLVELAASMSLGDRIRFLGPQWNVEPYMRAADCLVCPSIWGEAVGLVNLEALSTGLPVVASSVGGIPEFVTDDKCGFLFPAGDHAQLAERLGRLHRDPALVTRLGHNARQEAVARFSIERRIPEYVRAYEG